MDKDIISKVAEVARLKLGEDDMEKLGRDFDDILKHLSRLNELKLAGEEAVYATSNANVLRKDEEKKSDAPLMGNVPRRHNRLIKVPRGL